MRLRLSIAHETSRRVKEQLYAALLPIRRPASARTRPGHWTSQRLFESGAVALAPRIDKLLALIGYVYRVCDKLKIVVSLLLEGG